MRALLLAVFIATITGCVSGRTMRASDAMEKTSTQEQTPAPRHAGAVALEEEARTFADEGDFARAVVTLERALRLSPNDARLWLALAQVRFAQGDHSKAQALAERAAQLAGRDLETADKARRLALQARRRP